MARVEIPLVILTDAGVPASTASVTITQRSNGAAATWYTSETGGAGSTAPIAADSKGRVTAWVDRGAYNLAISGTGIASGYTESFDATPGGAGTIDTPWVADSSITTVKIATPESFHEVGAGGEPAFQNGWTNYDATRTTAAFYKDHLGRVHLKGVVKNVAGQGVTGAIFTLPAGYRPSAEVWSPTISSAGAERTEISTAGLVTVPRTVSANTWWSLDGISFRV